MYVSLLLHPKMPILALFNNHQYYFRVKSARAKMSYFLVVFSLLILRMHKIDE